MGTVGIVVLGIIGGMFILLELLVGIALIYLFFYLKRILSEFRDSLHADLATIRTGLELQQSSIATALDKVNGEQLSQSAVLIVNAAKQNMTAAKRMETAALAIGELVLSAEVKQNSGLNLRPDEFADAEPGESFVTQSRTAALDTEAEREEG